MITGPTISSGAAGVAAGAGFATRRARSADDGATGWRVGAGVGSPKGGGAETGVRGATVDSAFAGGLSRASGDSSGGGGVSWARAGAAARTDKAESRTRAGRDERGIEGNRRRYTREGCSKVARLKIKGFRPGRGEADGFGG